MKIAVCVDIDLVSQDVSVPRIRQLLTEDDPQLYTVIESPSIAALQFASLLSSEENVITAVTYGGATQLAALEYALAFGITRLIRLAPENGNQTADPQQVAKALARWLGKEDFDLIVCGSRSGSGLVPPMIAAHLNIPALTRVYHGTLCESRYIELVQRLERGWRQKVRVQLPALVTVQSGSFSCRYVSVRRRRLARLDVTDKVQIIPVQSEMPEMGIQSISAPKPRAKRTNVPDAKQSAQDRLKALIGGGNRAPLAMPTGSSQGQDEKRIIEESPEKAAEEIIKFLRQKELLPEKLLK